VGALFAKKCVLHVQNNYAVQFYTRSV